MRMFARSVMDADPAELNEVRGSLSVQERQIFDSMMADEYEKIAQSDITAAMEADTQTWQASLGTNQFGTKEAPTDLQVLINQTEDPQQLRSVLGNITETGTLPASTIGTGAGAAIEGVPKGTEFSVREAQDGSGVDVVYRLPGEQEWNQFDPPGLSGRNVLAWLKENFGIGAIASMGADALLASKMGPVGRAAVSIGTAAAGRAVDESLEPVMEPDLGAIAGSAAESGIMGGVGSALGDAAGMAANALTGRGLKATAGSVTPSEEAARAGQAAMQRQGWDLLSLGEAGRAVSRAGEQTAAATGRVEAERQTRRLSQPIESLIREAGGQSIADVPISALQEARDAALDEARRDFSAGIADLSRRGELTHTTPERFGRQQQDRFEKVVKADKAIGTRLFDEAEARALAEGTVLDLTGFIDSVREVRKLAELRGFPEEELGTPNPAVQFVPGTPDRTEVVGVDTAPTSIGIEVPIDQTRTVPGTPPRVDVVRGSPIPIGDQETIVNWAQGYRPAFRQLFKIIDDLNPEQPATYFEGVRRIQSWLGAMSDPRPGMIVDPESIRVAAILSKSLDDSIRNSPGAQSYVAALDHSKNFWSGILQFQRSMDLFKPKGDRTASYGERVYRAFAGDDPELLTEQGALAALRVLRGDEKGLLEFRGAVARDAMRNPDRIPTLLQNMDVVRGLPNGQEIFPVSLRNQLEAFQARLANADYGQLNEQIKAFQSGAVTAQKIIEGGRQSLDQVNMLLRQGIWTPDQLRGYILFDLAQKVQQTGQTRGAQMIDPAKYQAELKRLKESGLLDLLPASSRQLLEDVDTLTQFLNTSSDIGSGMASGTINQRRLQSPLASPVYWYSTFKQKYVGLQAWLGAQPNFVRLMGYGERPPKDWRMVREVARLATESMARMPQTTDLTEGQPSTEVTPLEPAQ
jgi:hypothetical protein